MPKPSRKRRLTLTPTPRDENQAAFDVVKHIAALGEVAIEPGKDPLMALFGRRGGLKGGPARAAKLTAAQRRKSAIKAARARWNNKRRSGSDSNR